MHVFALAVGSAKVTLERLIGEVADVGRHFRLDPSTGWHVQSPSGRLRAAGVHHSAEAIGERVYVARSSREVVIFDGLPIASDGCFAAWDAGVLADRWESAAGELEGQFCAARLDLEADRAEVLLDPLGLVRMYVASHGQGLVASTSASILGRLVSASRVDELAVASLLALGWAVEGRTLLGEVRSLDGGALHTLSARGLESSPHFGPAQLVRRRPPRRPTTQLAEELTRLVATATEVGSSVLCALTAGHDTRVLAALLQHVDAPVTYYTGGSEGSLDVEIAIELAEWLGVDHQVTFYEQRELDWTEAAAKFVAQNDGMSSLIQLVDYIELDRPRDRLDLTLWGVGGEIGRAGTGPLSNVSPNLPVLSRLDTVQQRLLALKVDDQGLLTPAGRATVLDYLRRFASDRRAEGWPSRELSEVFYTFERVANWGATGPRRTAGVSDVFSPYGTRPFIKYCFSLTPQERYLEAPHHRLLQILSPALLHHRFEQPFRPQRRSLAGAMATRQLIKTVRVRRRHGEPASAGASGPSFLESWTEQHLDLIGALVEDADPSVWQLIDQARLRSVLHSDRQSRAGYTDTLLRTVTVLWYLKQIRDGQTRANAATQA